jgi:small subunit ribosomal protein S3
LELSEVGILIGSEAKTSEIPLVEDSKIRKYLNERLAKASVSRIVIERTLKLVTITICTARPGLIIGKGGQDVDKLKEELKKLYDKEIQINIFEVKKT